MTNDTNIYEKLKEFLIRKLSELKIKIKNLKRKRNINKVVIGISAVSSIIITSIIASVSISVLPPLGVTIPSVLSAVLTGITAKFNFQDKTITISREIDRLNQCFSTFYAMRSTIFFLKTPRSTIIFRIR